MRARSVLIVLICLPANSWALASGPDEHRLLIAFASLRDDPLHPSVFFYEHDGQRSGRIVGQVPPAQKRSDHHPSLSPDGRLCVFAAEVVTKVCRIECWNRETDKLVDLASVNTSPNAQMAPTIGSKFSICFEAWNRPGSSGRWDLLGYDLASKQLVELPNLNTSQHNERKPALSGDGRWLAFTTDSAPGGPLSEIAMYDRTIARRVAVPNLNSRFMDTEPSLSRDGHFVAFVTDRSGGQGARDISLYDRRTASLVALPGLNSVGQEQSPSISPDGRYIAFVSERLEGAGERDIYVYDRATRRLLSLPGLNSPRDEYDPCVILSSNVFQE